MPQERPINILDILTEKYSGKPTAELPDEGDIIYLEISPLLTDSTIDKILLDFTGVPSFTGSFVNNAVGRLYLNFEQTLVDKKLIIQGLATIQNFLVIRECVLNAIKFSKRF